MRRYATYVSQNLKSVERNCLKGWRAKPVSQLLTDELLRPSQGASATCCIRIEALQQVLATARASILLC